MCCVNYKWDTCDIRSRYSNRLLNYAASPAGSILSAFFFSCAKDYSRRCTSARDVWVYISHLWHVYCQPDTEHLTSTAAAELGCWKANWWLNRLHSIGSVLVLISVLIHSLIWRIFKVKYYLLRFQIFTLELESNKKGVSKLFLLSQQVVFKHCHTIVYSLCLMLRPSNLLGDTIPNATYFVFWGTYYKRVWEIYINSKSIVWWIFPQALLRLIYYTTFFVKNPILSAR